MNVEYFFRKVAKKSFNKRLLSHLANQRIVRGVCKRYENTKLQTPVYIWRHVTLLSTLCFFLNSRTK